MIKAVQLTKITGNRLLLDDISFSAAPGESVGVLGAPGAGKTDLLSVLSGYTAPTWGKVTVAGADVHGDRKEAARHIGYLPAQTPLYRDMTAAEHLLFVYKLKKARTGNRAGHIDEMCRLAGFAESGHAEIGSLPPLSRRRLGLAQALIGDPEVLLLDDPVAGLDTGQAEELRETIQALAGSRTLFVSARQPEDISALCGRVIILEQGAVLADGPAGSLLANPGLYLRAAGAEDTVLPLLRRMYGVEDAVCTGEVEPGSRDYEITCHPDSDIRPALCKVFSEAEISILMLFPRPISLEETIRRLSAPKGAPRRAARARGAAAGNLPRPSELMGAQNGHVALARPNESEGLR